MTRARRIVKDSGLVGLVVVCVALIGVVLLATNGDGTVQSVAIAAVGGIVAAYRLKSAAKKCR